MKELLESIEEYLEARKEYAACVYSCEYDAGYFCSSEEDNVELALQKSESIFKKLIAQAVEEIIKK
jgi:hypothetical protein